MAPAERGTADYVGEMADAYDATADVYASCPAATGSMAEARAGYTATGLADGRVLAAGGGEASAEVSMAAGIEDRVWTLADIAKLA